MDIEEVLKSVEVAIDKFKTAFPELIEYANIEHYKSETIEAILVYEKKATLLKKDLLLEELIKYFNTGREIFDEGFHRGSDRDRADNVLVGMLEMNWIESFLNEINKTQKVALDPDDHKPKDMKQIFNLDNSNTAYSYEPNKKLRNMVEKLNEILPLKEKLQFYNDNICSFSYSFPDGEICEYGFKRWRGCGNVLFKLIPNTEIFSLFLEIRANEVERLKKLIDSKVRTVDKIKVLFEDRAGSPDIENEIFRIETNQFVAFLRNGAGVHPEDLKTYELNLLPLIRTSQDKKDFNEYLYNFYSTISKNPESQPLINKLENSGFNFEFAISAFLLQLQNSLDYERTLKNEIQRIEKHFPINDFNNMIYGYYDNTSSESWKCALFNAFINGVQYDFSVKRLEPAQIKDLLHIEQVFFYYKELLKVRRNGQNTTTISHNAKTQNLDIIQNNKFLEYNTAALLEMLIKQDNMLKSDYLQFVEKYNISTPEKLKTFYTDYVNFAARKINLKIIDYFKNKESQDYIINVLLKSAIKEFKSRDNYVFPKPTFLFLDDIFILDHKNIFIKAEEIFFNGVIGLASDRNIFSDWDSNEADVFWEKFSKSNYFDLLNFTEINSSVRTISFLSKEILSTGKNENTLSVQKPKENNEKPLPTIKTEAIPIIFEILKDFFDARSQNEFKTILETFGNTNEKLNFKSNGNQFADTFKKLFDNHFIIGLQKNDLINWIALNFNFLHRSEVTDFKIKTLESIISGKQNPCKKPIIEIKNGQISKIDY